MGIQKFADTFISTKSEKSFSDLMKRLRPGLLKKISHFEDSYEKCDEIVNIVFAKAWANIDQYSKDRGAFSTWIYRIAHNECLLDKRHTNRTKSFDKMMEEGSIKESAISFEENYDSIDLPKIDVIDTLYNKTIDAIHSMSSNGNEGIIKTALIKWHIDKKPYKTIAQEMNIPENTAKNKVFRGKGLLKQILIEREPDLVRLFEENQLN